MSNVLSCVPFFPSKNDLITFLWWSQKYIETTENVIIIEPDKTGVIIQSPWYSKYIRVEFPVVVLPSDTISTTVMCMALSL